MEGTHEGLAATRARGRRLRRPPAKTAEQIRHARDLAVAPAGPTAADDDDIP